MFFLKTLNPNKKPVDKVEPKFKVGQKIKKEGFNLGFTIVKIEDGFYYNDIGDYFPFTDQDNWELVEQKPAWSEEDEEILDGIIVDVEVLKEQDRTKSGKAAYQKEIDWLKSLKPKNRWKPSLSQLNALSVVAKGNTPDDIEEINSLYNDLKKL